MHISVADEHPLTQTGRRKGSGKRAKLAAILPFLESFGLSRSAHKSLRHQSRLRRYVHVFGRPLDGGRKAKPPLNIEGENPCNSVSPFWQAP